MNILPRYGMLITCTQSGVLHNVLETGTWILMMSLEMLSPGRADMRYHILQVVRSSSSVI